MAQKVWAPFMERMQPETLMRPDDAWRPLLRALRHYSIPLSTTRDAGAGKHPDRVRVTHRFHPLSGRSFEFVNRRKSWQSDRVYFFDDAGELACLPAEWTDVVPGDPFVVVSAGRSPFRTADLLELAELVGELRQGAGLVPDDVKRITP